MFGNYIIVALRSMKRHKVYSAINIIGLAVGLGCTIIIAHLVIYHLSFDRFHANFDRLYRTTFDIRFPNTEPFGHGGSFAPMGPDFKELFPEVREYARLYRKHDKFTLYGGGKSCEFWRLLYAEPSFFDLFSFPLADGDPGTALSDRNGAVLTQRIARECFGDDNPLGRMIVLNGEDSLTVTGILEDIPGNSHIQFDLLLPLTHSWTDHQLASYRAFPDFFTYLLLAPGTDSTAFEIKAQNHIRRNIPFMIENMRFGLQPLRDIHLRAGYFQYDLNMYKSDISLVYVFSTIAVMVLLIACINYVNLTTARSSGRDREAGIRKVLGAHRSQLTVQFLWESVLMCFLGIVLAFAVLAVLWPFLGNIFGSELYHGRVQRWIVPAGATFLLVVVGILAGLYPAMFFSRPEPQKLLHGKPLRTARGIGLRRLLVVMQYAVSIFLIISSILVGRQLHWITTKDLGFIKDNIVIVPLSERIRADLGAFTRDVRALPAVLGTCENGYDPLGHGLRGTLFRIDEDSQDYQLTSIMSFGRGFVDFYELDIVQGSDLNPETGTGAVSSCLVNETMWRNLGGNDVTGRVLWITEDMGPGREVADERPYRINGVVRDFHFHQLRQKIQPMVLIVNPDQYRNLAIKINPDASASSIGDIRKTWLSHDPDGTFNHYVLDYDIDNLYLSERYMEKLVVFFSMMATFLASLGLFGLISFTVELRTKEIGIRKILGASVSDIVLLLVREYILLLTIANFIAWPVAWYFAEKWFERFAYHIDMGAWPFIAGGLIAIIFAGLTIGRQAFTAATANPVEALRYE